MSVTVFGVVSVSQLMFQLAAAYIASIGGAAYYRRSFPVRIGQ